MGVCLVCTVGLVCGQAAASSPRQDAPQRGSAPERLQLTSLLTLSYSARLSRLDCSRLAGIDEGTVDCIVTNIGTGDLCSLKLKYLLMLTSNIIGCSAGLLAPA